MAQENQNSRERAEKAGEQEKLAGKKASRTPGTDGLSAKEIEALETDGKGTGGAGADLGGYGNVPGSDTTG